ncbi:MAG: hypothetical protein HOC71_01275 [Candidatus Latescibacteria bacterium]|jgi:BlaI family transcriptional regulator, penicillinase repressor|nr:hypothetical protein [Candidatus Latescibacterota bacterium]
MGRWKARTFTEGELDFMKVLWAQGESTPEDIVSALGKSGREVTGGTVRNVLAVMIEKGYVKRRKRSKAYLYKAKIDKENAQKNLAQNLLKNAFEGSESLLMKALLKNQEIHPEELNMIEKLIKDKKLEDKK